MSEFALARAGRDAEDFACLMQCAARTLDGRAELGKYVDVLVEYPLIRDYVFQGDPYIEDGTEGLMIRWETK